MKLNLLIIFDFDYHLFMIYFIIEFIISNLFDFKAFYNFHL